MNKLLIFVCTIPLMQSAFAMDGQPPLDLSLVKAVDTGNAKKVKRLLERGASPHAKTKKESFVLSRAVYCGYVDICKQLIAAGADVRAPNKTGNHPLIFAAMHGNNELCTLLMNEGANVNAKGGDDKTPLLWAAGLGHANTFKLLLDNGADVFATTVEWDLRMVMLIIANDEDKRDGKNQICQLHKEYLESLATKLIEEKKDLEKPDAQGRTLLHHAVLWNHERLCNMLIAAGTNVNAQNDHGINAIRYVENWRFYDNSEGHGVNVRISTALINAGSLVDKTTLENMRRDYESLLHRLVFQPDLKTLPDCKKNILHLLWCFKNMHPQLPKDIQKLLLSWLPAPDLSTLMVARRLAGKPIDALFTSATMRILHDATSTRLKNVLKTIGPELSNQIRENITDRLAQPKLLCNGPSVIEEEQVLN